MGGSWRAPQECEGGLRGGEEVRDADGRHGDVRTLEVRVGVHKCVLDVLAFDIGLPH